METAVTAQIHPVCTSRLSSPPVGQGAGEREGAPCAAGRQLLVSYGNAVLEQVNHGPNPKSRSFYPSGGYLWVRSVLFRQLLQEDLLTFFCATSCTWRSSSCRATMLSLRARSPARWLGSRLKHTRLLALQLTTECQPSLFQPLKAPRGQDLGFIHTQINTDAEQRASCTSIRSGRPEIPVVLQMGWDLLLPRVKARK